MYISRKHNLVFLPIPKSASRSFGTLFRQQLEGSTENLLHHEIAPPEDVKDYLAFSVVRNPYSRVVSKWWGTMRSFQNKNHVDSFDKDVRRKAFKAYIQQLKPGDWGNEYNNFHLTPQYSIIDRAQYYFSRPIRILKLENISEEINALASEVGVGNLKLQKIGNGSSEYGDWRQYYRQPWMSRKVHDCFREDFVRFGYSRKIE